MKSIINIVKKYPGISIAIAVTIIVMWRMLLPGYILTLDLVFTPSFLIDMNSGEFVNSLPLLYLLQALYTLFPGWLVEKLLLISMFLTLSYVSFTYLPVPQKFYTKLFASLLYTANSFVYIRMISGQWVHLYAYALLPLLIHLLIRLTSHELKGQKEVVNTCMKLALCITTIGIFSLHLFLLSVFASVVWILVLLIARRDRASIMMLARNVLMTVIALFIVTSYWTIPAMLRSNPVEQNFNQIHLEAFAASAHGSVPVLLNVLSLNGFWGERYEWAKYFAWPQTFDNTFVSVLFWLSVVAVIKLSIIGVISLYRNRKMRPLSIYLVVIALGAYVLALGAADTIFQTLNVYLYTHVPYWNGLRDSHKLVSLLALSYAILAGYGFDKVIEKLKARNEEKVTKDSDAVTLYHYALPILFVVPIFFGAYVWMGFNNQLRPVQYPASWTEAKMVIDADASTSSRILILPWQGYFSLAFNQNLIVANPGRQFYGPRSITSQNFRLGGIYDQSNESIYKELDTAVTDDAARGSTTTAQNMLDILRRNNVDYIIFFQDIVTSDVFTYTFLKNADILPIMRTDELQLYKIMRK